MFNLAGSYILASPSLLLVSLIAAIFYVNYLYFTDSFVFHCVFVTVYRHRHKSGWNSGGTCPPVIYAHVYRID